MKIGRSFRRAKASQGTESVFRGMLTLAMGSGAARLVSVAAIPILSRIYAPEDYGVLSVFTALTLLLAPLLTLRYLTALPLPRHEGLALSLLALCGILVAGGAALVSVLLWTFGPYLLRLMSMEALIPYRWLIVVCLVGAAAYETMVMWATRARAYRDIAKTQFTQSALKALCQIGLGLLAIKPLGLLIGHTVGVSAGLGSLLWRSRERFRDNARFITWRNIGRVAGGYRSFPLYRLPSQLLLVFSMQAPLLFTAAIFDAATTGQLGLAVTALTMPMSLIGTAVGRAFYGEIAALGKKQPQKIYALSKSTQVRLLLVGIPVALVIAFFGEEIFIIVFGRQWQEAGIYASWLAPYVLFQLTSAPLMNVLNIYDRQGVFLAINLVRAASLLLLFGAVHQFGLSSYEFVPAYSVVMTIFYVGISLYVLYAARQKTLEKKHETSEEVQS